MKDFAAIDFETANEFPSSVCSVGVVVVRDGQICDRYYSLIRPEPEYHSVFPDVWAEVSPLVCALPLVAHNARFDEGCLKAVHRVYCMDYPDYMFYDTLAASRRHFGRSLPNHQLHTVAEACGYILENHHHALADAEACASIALKLL